MSTATTTYLTATAAAKLLHVRKQKVFAWIASRELVAKNVATDHSERPNWRIRAEDLEAFLRRREPIQTPRTRRRLKRDRPWKNYYE